MGAAGGRTHAAEAAQAAGPAGPEKKEEQPETPFAGGGGGRLGTDGTDDEDLLAAEDAPAGLVERLLTAAVIGVAVAAVLAYLVAGRPHGQGTHAHAGEVAAGAAAEAKAPPARRTRRRDAVRGEALTLAKERGD